MQCQQCGSKTDVRAFKSEIGIHFPGWEGLSKPLVFVFPKINVCAQCGSASFVIPEPELRELMGGKCESASAS
jgi:hypothetical protein